MDYFERYRNIKIRITDNNYNRIVAWFNDVDPGSFVDFCVSQDETGENVFCLWNQTGSVLKLNKEETFIFDDELHLHGMYLPILLQSINQIYDAKGRITRERMNDSLSYNSVSWERFSKSDFFTKCVDDSSYYFDFRRHESQEIMLRYYNDYINRLFSTGIYNEIPSKLFIMGDIGIYKVEKESIIISFDIRINVNESEDFFIRNLYEYDERNEVKPFKYRKVFLDYLFSAINDMNSIGNDYAYLEIPLMPRINKLIRLLYMYFSAKGIFRFRIVDDLTMLNIYKRENLSSNDIIRQDPEKGEVYRGNHIIYPRDMQSKVKIVPEDIVYNIDQPLGYAELMTLLGKYREGYSLKNGEYDNDLREIYLCLINIERTAQHLTEVISDDYYNYETIRALLIKKVFYHELGHMIFRKVSPKQTKAEREITANWVACLSYDQANTTNNIRFITYKLCKEQTESYQQPLMIPDFKNISLDQYNNYCNELKKLLEK